MCGRFVLHTAISRIAKRYWDYRMPLGDMIAHYNIAPGIQVHTVRQQEDGRPDFILAHWGFKPAWAGEGAPVPIWSLQYKYRPFKSLANKQMPGWLAMALIRSREFIRDSKFPTYGL